ncbi:metallophosphoesterase [Cytobacillus spongiae]|uniref:metallophosphoesterase n=1 Tax=Cytobacillus spongiae TaxID=2901381 RepID=UPI001F2AC39C|nr:metallophosphoesterase [Cytobacillus spongiae]UII56429.1 metallophosphoesterase [Cytobacillus spongiae]
MKQFSIFARIVLVMLVFNGFLFYIGLNIKAYLTSFLAVDLAGVYWFVFFLLCYSYFLDRLTRHFAFFRIVGSFMLGFFQYALVLFPVANLIYFSCRATGISASESTFWIGSATVFVLLLLFAYGMYNAYSPTVREYQIDVPKRMDGKETLRITMASDMHFGRLSGIAHAKRLVKEVNETKPDVILLAGDIIDDELTPFQEKKMGDILQELHAPLGVFGVLGNHEYYGGQVEEFVEEMRRIGIRILLDESVLIDDRFYLVGRKDKTDRGRMSYHALTSSLDPSYPIISMDHQPAEIQQAYEARVDLSFSGHTHRGQMAPNHLITKRIFELDWGYLQKEQLHAFVSSGFGFWGPPLRIGSRSEILQVDVTFES